MSELPEPSSPPGRGLRAPARWALAAVLALGAGCTTTPLERALDHDLERLPSTALPPDPSTDLAALLGLPAPDGGSSFAVLDGAHEGLDARLALVEAARHSLDVQTYLWHEDASGSLLLERLLAAADRGVRVRLVIDGFRVEDLDLDRALAAHPRLEVRAFNPAHHRAGLWRLVELAEHLGQYDHRMHDKLLVADGVAAVFGGRNVGDEYFGLGEGFDFRDFDLFGSGAVVPELAAVFDEFWNGPAAIPLRAPDEAARPGELEEARAALRALHAEDPRLHGRRALGREQWLAALARLRSGLVAGRATVLHDEADLRERGATGLMARAFERVLEREDGDLLIVTAYLVPDAELIELLARHVRSGHRVRILTNSMLTTNQPLAHAFYQERRRALLEAGVELYELRPDAFGHVRHRSPGSRGRFLGLHAKSAVLGRDLVLVGSMNLDPRSMVLNTELGVLVESEALAAEVHRRLERELAPRNAWRVALDGRGRLTWTSSEGTVRSEPAPGTWSRVRSWLLGWLPVGGEV